MYEIQPSLIRPIYYIIFSCNMIKLRGPFLILCPAGSLASNPSFASFYSIVVVLLLPLLLLCPCSRGPSIINPSSLPPTRHTRSKLKGSSPLCDNRSGITKRTRRVATAHHVFRSVVVALLTPSDLPQRRDAFVPTCLLSTAPATGLASELSRDA